ncbi:MAG: 16S rRNA (cytidine(1402)-2'-O)-methyltransferase [Candidatus Buchananbacteria bacterium]
MANLYLIATPIGNLADITFRAVKTLQEVDLIACEDTRQTKKLLAYYQISKPTISYHQHSKVQKIDYLVEQLQSGKNIAVVSDAGTPGLCDPGGYLVSQVLQKAPEVQIVPIPGVTALATLISVAGISLDNFLFLGFLPHKKGRETMYKKIVASEVPVIFYESSHRVVKCLEALAKLIPERPVIIGRELTKMFETIYRGTVAEVKQTILSDKKNEKGEFVIIIEN